MMNYLARFFTWLFPILKSASIQVAADTLTDLARNDRRRAHRYYRPRTSYGRFIERPQRPEPKVGPNPFISQYGLPKHQALGFHDVLMVAFDIRSTDAEHAHAWLAQHMPAPGDHGDFDEINLDSCWIANDERFQGGDADSAVFVFKGHQEEARELLRKHGLGN